MIPADRAHLHVTANSHPGMSGKNNEDRFAISAYWLEEDRKTPVLLTIVSDGIGGHRAGEVAAEIAVETISRVIAASDLADPPAALHAAIVQASQAIYLQSEKQENQRGMGATCACGLVIGERLYTANVGDSRIYLMRGVHTHQLTVDHTWVQEALEQGVLKPDQVRGHPNAHVIRRYLGSKQEVIPDFRLRLSEQEDDAQAEANQGIQLQPGDRLVLCSDGLTDLVDEDEIREVIEKHPQEAAIEQLIELANQRGGHDNITVITVEVPGSAASMEATIPAAAETPMGKTMEIPPVPTAAPAPTVQTKTARPAQVSRRRQRLGWTCLGVSLLALTLALIVAGALVFINLPVILDTLAPSPTAGDFPQPPAVLPLKTRVDESMASPTVTQAPPDDTPFSLPTATRTPRVRPVLSPTTGATTSP